MHHIAIDLGSRKSQVCVRDEKSKILEERSLSTFALKDYLLEQPKGRVIVETCAESFAVADAAREMGHEIRIVPATLVKQLGVGERRLKNDKKDAQKLSEVSTRIDLPSVHLPSARSKKIREVCNMRESLVEARTKLVNSVRALARMHVLEMRTGAVESVPARIRLTLGDKVSPAIERVLTAIEELNAHISAADKEVRKLAKEHEQCLRLMTAPGVGPVTALRFVAVVDDVGRFATAHQLESYLGLVPSDRSTGQTQQRLGSITKAGAKKVRWALVQAVWSAKAHYKLDPLVLWSERVALRRGKKIATIAMARKLAGVLFAMLRDGTEYDDKKLTEPRWQALKSRAA